MHILTIARSYLGMTQTELANAAGVTQADISELENLEPYGQINKYCRLSKFLDIPVDALVKNDLTQIPLSFFDRHPAPVYTAAPASHDLLLGRQGEEFILRRERDRLAEHFPALSKLVLPFYKMKGSSPGYDILSFDDTGKPVFLEVKTSLHDSGGFRLTNNELESAQKLTEAGERYILCYISKWGTAEQEVQNIPFDKIERTHRIAPCYYFCKPIPKSKTRPISGLSYHRQKRGLRQADISEALNIPQCDWSLYENGQRKPSIGVYVKTSELLDVPIDELLKTYPCAPSQEVTNG